MIRNDWGFNIYRAVSDTKVRLSSASTADFGSSSVTSILSGRSSREDFEGGSRGHPHIEETVDGCSTLRAFRVGDIDNVFLTGGSSFIPAVRRIFATRFGPDRLADGENFQSVAFGLALIGLEDDLDPWLAKT